ncbi:50S ribosomal protein L23 [Candidatus Uhrbacteria bacterium]|nr:50S ribosomal protein L23 [Candidatus Uhrbacteria bacterium]MBD3284408.1 50S ribosomal protein L23 [Candidatus Uhrbacteria bacterium]
MALFDRFKKDGKKPAAPAAKASAVKTDAKKPAPATTKATPAAATDAKKEVSIIDAKAGSYAHLLLKPHVSEKAAVLADKGIYVFDVPVSANKVEIGKAVEAIYKVNVAKVRTQRGLGKAVRRGRMTGRRNAWKKALVELKKGQTISLVEGV